MRSCAGVMCVARGNVLLRGAMCCAWGDVLYVGRCVVRGWCVVARGDVLLRGVMCFAICFALHGAMVCSFWRFTAIHTLSYAYLSRFHPLLSLCCLVFSSAFLHRPCTLHFTSKLTHIASVVCPRVYEIVLFVPFVFLDLEGHEFLYEVCFVSVVHIFPLCIYCQLLTQFCRVVCCLSGCCGARVFIRGVFCKCSAHVPFCTYCQNFTHFSGLCAVYQGVAERDFYTRCVLWVCFTYFHLHILSIFAFVRGLCAVCYGVMMACVFS